MRWKSAKTIRRCTIMDKAESVDPKVEYSDSKSLVEKQSFRKTKIVAIVVLAVVLLLGAVISMTLFFTLNQRGTPTPDRFTEVNLQEGETLTYRVDQKLELHEGKVLSGNLNLLYATFKIITTFCI